MKGRRFGFSLPLDLLHCMMDLQADPMLIQLHDLDRFVSLKADRASESCGRANWMKSAAAILRLPPERGHVAQQLGNIKCNWGTLVLMHAQPHSTLMSRDAHQHAC